MTEVSQGAVLEAQIWATLQLQAKELHSTQPIIRKALEELVLDRHSFGEALSWVLADAMRHSTPRDTDLTALFTDIVSKNSHICESAATDLEKLDAVNPACPDLLTGFLSFRGFLALQLYRIARELWLSEERQLAVMLQNWGAIKFSIDIHPAARIGKAVFFDHGMGIVVGATAVIEDGVNMWHGVTLGSTLTEAGDRHPKVRRNATICAGATVLGNIEIGEGALIAATSVVLKSVPPGAVVAGVPGRTIGQAPSQLSAIDKEFKSASTQTQET